MNKKKDWFKLKRYPHIGFPLEEKDRTIWIENYIKDPDKIAKHSFLPFIHKTYKQRKFRKKYSEENGEVLKNACDIRSKKEIAIRNPDEKNREIFYAGHLDALVYSYYSFLLSEKYNKRLIEIGLENCITAYRSIKINSSIEKSSNKCNIDFANEIFTYIKNNQNEKLVVMAFDITSFFDNLNHKILLKNWIQLIEVTELPNDHFNVYKNITRFSYVDQIELFETFKNKLWIERKVQFQNRKIKKQKSISNIKYLKNQGVISYCKSKEFFKHRKRLVHQLKHKSPISENQKRDYGIPQGSPISSVLANLYLIDFDKKINDFVSLNDGIYRRYSDDMVTICREEDKKELEKLIYSEIENYKLEIQRKKTQIFHFVKENENFKCGQEFERNHINWNKNFIYLGFEFDGKNVLLKSASLSGYYRKMKRTIRRGKHFTNKIGSKTKGEFFKNRILKKYSYKGSKRRRKYLWNELSKKFEKSERYDWGNFLSYAYKASKIMISNKIKNQTKRHWKKIEKLI